MNKKILFSSLLLSLGFVALMAWMGFSSPGVTPYYVSTGEVYQAFDLTSTLNAELEQTKLQRQLKLDSLQTQLRQLATALDQAGENATAANLRQFEALRTHYLQTSEQTQQDNEALAVRLDEQIRTQLNAYIKAFGDEKGLDVLLGAQGQGNLLYAKASYDLTEELILFVNQRYNDRPDA